MHLPDETALQRAAAALWPALEGGLCIALQGPVGAGKTAFVRQLLRAAGISGLVRSPTYTLVELYTISNLYLYHFDLYRFFDPEEWYSSGFDEFFNPQSVALVEWPEKAGAALPPADLTLSLDYADKGRHLQAEAHSAKGLSCLKKWKEVLAAM